MPSSTRPQNCRMISRLHARRLISSETNIHKQGCCQRIYRMHNSKDLSFPSPRIIIIRPHLLTSGLKLQPASTRCKALAVNSSSQTANTPSHYRTFPSQFQEDGHSRMAGTWRNL